METKSVNRPQIYSFSPTFSNKFQIFTAFPGSDDKRGRISANIPGAAVNTEMFLSVRKKSLRQPASEAISSPALTSQR